MNHSNADSALDKHFCLYQEHLREGAWYSAAVALAEIFHAGAKLSGEQRAVWQSRINEELTERFLSEVRKGQEERVQRIRRILSVGSEWTAEEVLLLMLLRVEIKLLSDFLGSRVHVESLRHLEDIDAQLATLAKSNHADHFRWALQRMEKNALFDIENVWRSLLKPRPR